MVQRLSCEEVLLSTFTEPSLIGDEPTHGVFDVSRRPGAKRSASAEDTNHRAGDGGHDEQQHHHGHGTVLVLVVEGSTEWSVSDDGFDKTAGVFKFRWVSPWNPFAFAYLATHDPSKGLQVIGIANRQAAASLIHRCR